MSERIIKFERGHDCLNFECICGSDNCFPGSGGSHGVGGLNIRFVLKGEAGAVQFVLATGWLPMFVAPSKIGNREFASVGRPMPYDLGYHSKTPKYTGQEVCQPSCEYCDGLPCYYDGSSLNANDAFYSLVNGGGEALWEFLAGYYNKVFNGADYPAPAEYKMPARGLK